LQAIEMTGGLSTWRVTARDNFAGRHTRIFGCAGFFLEVKMTKSRGKKAAATLGSPSPELCATVAQSPDEVRAILWRIARDPEQSGTARVAACRLLLMDARERGDGVDARHDADLDKRARALMREVMN
jgi:hypothetical protein